MTTEMRVRRQDVGHSNKERVYLVHDGSCTQEVFDEFSELRFTEEAIERSFRTGKRMPTVEVIAEGYTHTEYASFERYTV